MIRKVKNIVNKYMADIRPDRFTTCQSVVSRRPSVQTFVLLISLLFPAFLSCSTLA
jgi:hypothetical protein